MGGESIGTVSTLVRYPVKSMAGEALRSAAVSPAGVDGDRLWALRDLTTGELTGAKHLPGLLRFSAALSEEQREDGEVPHVRVTLPDGATASSADTAVHELISGQLKRNVRL